MAPRSAVGTGASPGDTLVTVIIEDKGLLEDHRLEPMLRLSNGLKHYGLSGSISSKNCLEKGYFWAHGDTLKRLKQIKATRGKLNLGFLCCRMTISGQNQQQNPQVQNLQYGFGTAVGSTPSTCSHRDQCPDKGHPKVLREAPKQNNTGASKPQVSEQEARLAKEAASIFKSLLK